MSTLPDVRPEFSVHKLNPAGMKKAHQIAMIFTRALNEIEEICGADGREMALVRTFLQEAGFFAKRSMAMRSENQLATNDTEPPPVA